MRTVRKAGADVLELNWLWLPTFIGMNVTLTRQLETELRPHLTGIPMDDAGLDYANGIVIQYLTNRFPELIGLGDYLDALKYVEG